MRTVMCMAWMTCVLTVIGGCARRELSGPPEVRLGRDECSECGMLINEDRCCSALLVERDGQRLHLIFDDVGCMLDHERDHRGEFRVIDGFVRDYSSRTWCNTAGAVFLAAEPEKLQTPMASGIVAFCNETACESAKASFGGQVLSYDRLADKRRAWIDAMRSGAKGAP